MADYLLNFLYLFKEVSMRDARTDIGTSEDPARAHTRRGSDEKGDDFDRTLDDAERAADRQIFSTAQMRHPDNNQQRRSR